MFPHSCFLHYFVWHFYTFFIAVFFQGALLLLQGLARPPDYSQPPTNHVGHLRPWTAPTVFTMVGAACFRAWAQAGSNHYPLVRP